MVGNTSSYFARYYEKNRAAILAKRRLRYQNDEGYRERMRGKARERAQNKAKEQRVEKAERDHRFAQELQERDLQLDELGPQKVKHWPVGEFVTSSVICTALDISIGTLSNWLRVGILPPPTVSSTAGKHLFSMQYLELVRDCRIESLQKSMENGAFGRLVNNQYKKIKAKEEKLRRGESLA